MHAITGVTQLKIAGETRTLACDMNCAAALYAAVGNRWPEWLTERYLGMQAEGGRELIPPSPADLMLSLHALLATDREKNPRPEETEQSLRQSILMGEVARIQVEVMRCVMTSFGVPGEAIDAVIKAVDARPAGKSARGTGTKR